MASSMPSGARQDGGMLPNGFPVGMRVLAVDDDCICLATLKQMLQRCGYQVTAKTTAEEALKELRENPEGFDLVMTDVHMPGMDGFGLLNHAKDLLPVIMFSADEDTETVTRGVVGGACDYLLKPLRMEEVRNIWQHVARRRLNVAPGVNAARRSGASSSNAAAAGGSRDGDKAKTSKKRGADEFDDEGSSNNQPAKSRRKKPKFYWGLEAHALFVKAVNQLQATEGPKRIKELLELEGVNVTAEQVASHLQKYRKHCHTKTKQQSNLNARLISAKASSSYTNSLKNYYNCQDATSSRMPNFSFIPGGQAHAILPHQPPHSVGTLNNHLTVTHKNYVKSQEIEINIRNYMRSQETRIGSGSLARQTSLLSDATSVGVLGNESQANKGSTASHGGVPTNEGLQVSAVKTSHGTQPQQKQCFSTGFPINFNAMHDSNPKTQVGFASQTSPLGYDNGVLSPLSGFDGLDDDVLMSSLLGGDEVMQNTTNLDGSQAMRDLLTNGDLSASQPQGLNSDFFNWGNTVGATSTLGGVLTDGMLNDQLHNELEKFNKLNMQ